MLATPIEPQISVHTFALYSFLGCRFLQVCVHLWWYLGYSFWAQSAWKAFCVDQSVPILITVDTVRIATPRTMVPHNPSPFETWVVRNNDVYTPRYMSHPPATTAGGTLICDHSRLLCGGLQHLWARVCDRFLQVSLSWRYSYYFPPTPIFFICENMSWIVSPTIMTLQNTYNKNDTK